MTCRAIKAFLFTFLALAKDKPKRRHVALRRIFRFVFTAVAFFPRFTETSRRRFLHDRRSQKPDPFVRHRAIYLPHKRAVRRNPHVLSKNDREPELLSYVDADLSETLCR